jgi:hypothetical protein
MGQKSNIKRAQVHGYYSRLPNDNLRRLVVKCLPGYLTICNNWRLALGAFYWRIVLLVYFNWPEAHDLGWIV